MYIIVIIFLAAILAFTIWNLLILKKIKNSTSDKALKKEGYYELKYRLQSMTTIAFIIIAVTGLIGYQSMEDVRNDLKSQLKLDIDSLQVTINEKSLDVNKLITNLDTLEISVKRLSNEQLATISNEAQNQKRTLVQVEKVVTELQNMNILKRNFYVVRSVKFSYKKNIDAEGDLTNYEKIYFRDLTTSYGDKLPLFSDPPILVPTVSSGVEAEVFNITKESFQVLVSGHFDGLIDSKDTVSFDLVIIEK